MSTPTNTIREAVRERYANYATSSESCCDTSSCCGGEANASMPGVETNHANLLYGESANELPVDVTGLSLGCGDPVAIASLQAGETVLDLGSGGGIDCFFAAKAVGETGYVIGVDMTDEMLSKANANKAQMGVTNVEFRKGYIEDLPVKDNTIDIIMSNCVINLSPDKSSVFSEAIRVLKPGGRVSISDIVSEGEFSDALRADMSKWAECVTGAIDVNDYTGLMREAGFVDIEVVDKVECR